MDHLSSHLADSIHTSSYNHAIVIGSSIAGLTAARVLADHFDRVTVIERDQLTEEAEYRKGVPHARHPHVLLLRGQMILEQLFPGLTEELQKAGAVTFNMGSEIRWFVFGKTRISYESETISIACSRPLLESRIYRHLLDHPKIQFVERSEVVSLETNADGTAITGVRLRTLNGDHRIDAHTRTIAADVVVDASGRESHAPDWLKALGYTPPKETTISSAPGYATRFYKRPADFPADIKAIYVQATPSQGTRGGIILPLEGDRWHVSLVGMAADYPPTDEAAFLEFARSLPSPLLYDAISQAEPLSPVFGYRRGENRERRYDQLPRYLEGFLVLGDAVYAFNPVYGQGMTVAAMSSLLLDQCLREQRERYGEGDLSGLARRFQAQLAEVTAGPWQMSTGEDQRWASMREGVELPPEVQLTQRYVDQVIKASLTLPAVSEAFLRVQQMLEPPTVFFRPDIVLQVFSTVLQSPAE